MLQKEKRKILLMALAYWFLAEFCSLMVCVCLMFTQAMGVLANIIFGTCAFLVLVLLFVDFSLKKGTHLRKTINSLQQPELFEKNKNFGIIIGLVGTIPCYITGFVNLLSRLGVIGNFQPFYKLLNLYFMPYFDLVAHSADIMDMSYFGFIFIFLMPLSVPIASQIAYRIGYNNIDLVDNIVYKK